MPDPDVLVLVLAGGKGKRLDLLTRSRAKPATPFAGMYRLIDFPLSNCLHSRIDDVWVLQQYQPGSLNDHLANGRPWDLDRTTGGLLVLPPFQAGGSGDGFAQGTADGLWRHADMIRDVKPRNLIVVSADAVYRMDYRAVLRRHRESDAVITMVTTEVDASDAGRYGVVQVDGERVTDYVYKPDDPASSTVSNEVFVMDPGAVLDELDAVAEQAGDDGLEDLGHELLPRLVASGRARAESHDGYWRDVGTIEAYWSANMDFLSEDPPFDLDDHDWPVRTQGGHRAPAWFTPTGQAHRSLISAAVHVGGQVEHSVLSSGGRVEEGAYVEDSVLLPGAIVRAGARVVRAVLDDSVEVGRSAVVGGADGDLTLLGGQVRIGDGERVEPGDRRPRDTDG